MRAAAAAAEQHWRHICNSSISCDICAALAALLMQNAMCVHRELQERLRSLVGGAITRMAREKAHKAQIADLENQLKVLKVLLLELCLEYTL